MTPPARLIARPPLDHHEDGVGKTADLGDDGGQGRTLWPPPCAEAARAPLRKLFAFVVIMTTMAVPEEHQHRVLTVGILVALVLRVIFIVLGATLLSLFSFMFLGLGLLADECQSASRRWAGTAESPWRCAWRDVSTWPGRGTSRPACLSWLPVQADSGYTGNFVDWVPDRVLGHS